MGLPRREFLASWKGGSGRTSIATLVGARGREAFEAAGGAGAFEPDPGGTAVGPIRLASNENPLGPGPAAIAALTGEFPQVMRYPFNSRRADSDLKAQIARVFSVKPENVVLGAGSGELLRNASRAFTTPTAHLVTASPTFATCEETCRQVGHPVRAVALDGRQRLDLDAMAAAATGAGLVFLCNPNNPSGTVHGAPAVSDFVARVKKASPDTAILIDEAYHEYVTDPAYATATPLALEYPGVFITRTFSKAYGMAGLRIGYAIGRPETMKALGRYSLPYNANVLAIAAATATFEDTAHLAEERARNTAVRTFTTDYFTRAGFKPTESQTNFVFVDLGRPARAFRDACAQHQVLIGRDFPPLHQTHSRISLGTMEEMTRATEVFGKVLGAPTTSASRG
jgi:histidinol-phosphate aminotransferase